MKKPILILVLLIISLSSLYAATDKPIVTVLDFNVSQVSEQEASILVDYISGHLVESNKYRVIDRTQRMTILKELQFSYDGCTDEECQLEIGKLLAARYIFIGSLGKIGSRYILNMSLVEVETGETLKSMSDKYNSIDALVDDTSRIVAGFTGQQPVPAPSETKVTEAKPAEPAPSAEKTEPAGETPVMRTPASSKNTSSSSSSSASSSSGSTSTKKTYFDVGFQVGGPIDSDYVDSVSWGLYFGSLVPLTNFFYLGGTLDFLVTTEDISTGALFFGASAILGNPGKFAAGIGVEAGNAPNYTGGAIVLATGTLYIGGIDLRLCYGEDLAYGDTVIKVGFGGHF